MGGKSSKSKKTPVAVDAAVVPDKASASSGAAKPFTGEHPSKSSRHVQDNNLGNFSGQKQEHKPKEFIGQINQEDPKTKEFIGQLKKDNAMAAKEIGPLEMANQKTKNYIEVAKESKVVPDFLNDFDDKDIDMDDDSKLFLKNMLLTNVETCDADDDMDDRNSFIVDEGSAIRESNGEKEQRFQPNFAQFPSHVTLKRENSKYCRWKKKFPDAKSFGDGYPEPSDTSKKDIFKKENFAEVDKHALEIPSEYLNKPAEDVVEYLVKVCHSDLEKVRVLFRWCCAQNLANLKGDTPSGSIKEQLMKVKEGNKTYAGLYECMCRCIDLPCQVISGAVKGVGYSVGQTIPDSSRSTWVAVKIKDIWRFVDLQFAARHQTGGNKGEWQLIDDMGNGYNEVDEAPIGLTYLLDEFFFLTDPEEFIYNHFPDDEPWQLLARPVTKKEFQDMAYLRHAFFTMGMNVLQAKRGTVHAPSGDTVIKFGLPKEGWRRFSYRLWKSSKDENKDFDKNGNKLTQFVYLEQKDGTVICRIIYPVTGKYKFQLYMKDSGEKDSHYSLCAEYLLLCTQIKELCVPLPTNNRQEWGPGQNLVELGMIPLNYKDGTIETHDGEVELVFSYDPSKPVDMLPKLSSQHENKTSNNWILHSTEYGKATINLRLQEKGHYALDIFAKHKTEDVKLPLVCTYLVISTSAVSKRFQFPDVSKVGSLGKNAEWNVTAVSHRDPYFTSKEGLETIVFQHAVPLRFSAELWLQAGDAKTEIKKHTFIEQNDTDIAFKTRFPKSGMYDLCIYAKKRDSSGALPNIYRYVVCVPLQLKNCRPFPDAYSLWGVGCRLYSPPDGQLVEQQDVSVSVVIPDAVDVAMIKDDGEWTHLTKNEEQEWTGNVNAGAAGKPLKLSAKFKKDSNSFSTLAKYDVLNTEELKDKETSQQEEYKIQEEQMLKDQLEIKNREANFTELEKEISDAAESHDLKRLYSTVGKVEARSYTTKLKPKYERMRNSIKSMERKGRLDNAIMGLDCSSIADVQDRSKHSKKLEEILHATLLLLNDKDDLSKELQNNPALADVLKKEISKFKLDTLSRETANRALQMLRAYKLDEVNEESATAASLYAWCLGMTEELNLVKKPMVKRRMPHPL